MKRILVLTEFSELSTGYATYAKQLLLGLHNAGFECLELARYISPKDPRVYNRPWKVVPNLPNPDNQAEVNAYNSNQLNIFGLWKFDRVCLEFKPHICITLSDFWMDNFIDYSPARPYFHWTWLITVDAKNQNEEWLDNYSRVDSLFTYNDWSKQQIEKESILKILGSVPPPINSALQPIVGAKERFNLQDKVIYGTVMRNQKRKLFPHLFESFRNFLNQSGREDVLLYCHTSFPDQGWDIPKLLLEYGLSSKVLFSYICRECRLFLPALFSDAVTPCPRCKQHKFGLANVQTGVSSEDLAIVYNLMDCYWQIASAEGFGIPILEAATCGVPVACIDYSAMHDVVRKLNGWPLKVLSEEMEVETGRLLAVPDKDFLTRKMLEFLTLSDEEINEWKNLTLIGTKVHYNYQDMINRWINHITSIDITKYDTGWKKPANIINIPNIVTNLSNRDFVRWLISDVLQDPSKLDSYFALKWVRNLNYGMVNTNYSINFMDDVSFQGRPQTRHISQEDAYNYVRQLAEAHNNFERLRTQ